jgi:hypothetical protein
MIKTLDPMLTDTAARFAIQSRRPSTKNYRQNRYPQLKPTVIPAKFVEQLGLSGYLEAWLSTAKSRGRVPAIREIGPPAAASKSFTFLQFSQ